MAETITDEYVVRALRPFVRAAGPVLDALRESDPLGLRARTARAAGRGAVEVAGLGRRAAAKVLDGLSSVHVPGTPAWAAMGVRERDDWWVNRVGRVTALLVSIPGLGGALADRLPVQDALGAAAQGLLLCAIAGEHGMTGTADRVRLLAAVLFGRDIDPALAQGHPATAAEEQARTDELTEDLAESEHTHQRVTVKAVGSTLWKLGKVLWSLGGELGKRPSGRFYHRALGMLPIVGMLGDYLGERSGLKRAARTAAAWIAGQRAGTQ